MAAARSRVLLVLLALSPFTGCGPATPVAAGNSETTPPESQPRPGAAFDPARCGRIAGKVAWTGKEPYCETFMYGIPEPDGGIEVHFAKNPHAPRVDPIGKGLSETVVFLRGVPVEAMKEWDLPPASVEMAGRQIVVRQGPGEPRSAGFVRRGATIPMASKEAVFHNLRARGAVYFSLAFPDPDQPLSRTFDRLGLVHLTSGSGHYWASAFLFVDEMPYYAITDREGRFTLDRVPAGQVDLVVWHPNWKVVRRERDPESSFLARQFYGPPLELVTKTTVRAGETAEVNVALKDQ